MDRMIASCGLNCEKCDAYIATKNNDQDLREKVAKNWSELNNATILPEHINCEGCRVDGVKTIFCDKMCQIRPCAQSRGFETCGECPEMNSCEKVSQIFANDADARNNLTNG